MFNRNTPYYHQVVLLVAVLPLVAEETCFALKGGTAINLFVHDGLTEELMSVFLVYLISGTRPIAEMLEPRQIPLVTTFNEQFLGMTFKEVTLSELEEARKQLIMEINSKLTDKQKQFLLSFKAMQPDWDLLDADNVGHLPAVQWKLLNLQKMKKQKHQVAMEKLEKVLLGDNHV